MSDRQYITVGGWVTTFTAMKVFRVCPIDLLVKVCCRQGGVLAKGYDQARRNGLY